MHNFQTAVLRKLATSTSADGELTDQLIDLQLIYKTSQNDKNIRNNARLVTGCEEDEYHFI